MKWLNDYRMRLMLLGIVAGIVFIGSNVNADFIIGEPINLGPVINWRVQDNGASLSTDGLSLFFGSDYPDAGYWKLFSVTRESTDAPWGDRVNLGPAVNISNLNSWEPSISADGLELYFGRGDRGKGIQVDLYVTTRETTNAEWRTATSLGETVNSTAHEDEPAISGDGLSLFFSSDHPGGLGGTDLWVTTRPSKQDAWRDPVNLGPTINSSSEDFAPTITADGLTLIFSSDRPGMYSSYADLWMTKRRSTSDPWGEPVNLGPTINTNDVDYADISPDGRTLYLSCFRRPGGYDYYDIWLAPIIPIVDLNEDGVVDALDMCIIVDHWGESYSLCDIGPTPFGDGIVDTQDLIILAEHLFEEPGLVAYWKLDEIEGEIAYDAANGYNGALHGQPIWQPEIGMVDGALQFDGVDDYITTPFVLSPADDVFSLIAWIQGGSPEQVVISQEGGVDWLMTDDVGNLMTELRYPGRSGKSLQSQTVITDGNWHRIGFVWDGSNRTLYVDDLLVAEDTQNGLESSNDGLYIGCGKNMEAGTYWSGLIDDVRIYNRVVTP